MHLTDYFSTAASEGVAEREFSCAAVEIRCGNRRQPYYCVGRLPLAVVAVVVPGHAVSETFAQVESRPPIRLLIIESKRSRHLKRIDGECISPNEGPRISDAGGDSRRRLPRDVAIGVMLLAGVKPHAGTAVELYPNPVWQKEVCVAVPE